MNGDHAYIKLMALWSSKCGICPRRQLLSMTISATGIWDYVERKTDDALVKFSHQQAARNPQMEALFSNL
jgi:hypothetical protein